MRAATDRALFEDAAAFAINVANAPRASHALSTFAPPVAHPLRGSCRDHTREALRCEFGNLRIS